MKWVKLTLLEAASLMDALENASYRHDVEEQQELLAAAMNNAVEEEIPSEIL